MTLDRITPVSAPPMFLTNPGPALKDRQSRRFSGTSRRECLVFLTGIPTARGTVLAACTPMLPETSLDATDNRVFVMPGTPETLGVHRALLNATGCAHLDRSELPPFPNRHAIRLCYLATAFRSHS